MSVQDTHNQKCHYPNVKQCTAHYDSKSLVIRGTLEYVLRARKNSQGRHFFRRQAASPQKNEEYQLPAEDIPSIENVGNPLAAATRPCMDTGLWPLYDGSVGWAG